MLRAAGRPPDRDGRILHRWLLAARLTERPGSSAYVAGGVVAYANEAKTELLGVRPDLLATHGAVVRPVADAMADAH